jgi:N-acetylmuramoyl-L-alanine amidase
LTDSDRNFGGVLPLRAVHILTSGRWLALAALALSAPCLPIVQPALAQSAPSQPLVADSFPMATDVRLAGDEKSTRFVLDLDKKIDVRAFALANPYRVVLDIPQVSFQLPGQLGNTGRGLIKAFRYGLVMPGGSRVVMDLTGPARIDKAYVMDAANDQPARLVVELSKTDRNSFMQALATQARPALRPPVTTASLPDDKAVSADQRPVVVIDPGHGGIDNGTVASTGEHEKQIVLDFALALRERLDKGGKYRVVLTRSDDTFIPLAERVQIARNSKASLFISLHADALPRSEGDAQGATIYTLSETASDAEAARLAETENRADVIGGIDLSEEPSEVADILIDLTQRETKTFSGRFARQIVGELKSVARMHKKPLKSAGFRVLKATDVPSVLVELGYVTNKDDLQHLVSDSWRSRTVGSLAQAIDAFFAQRVVTTGSVN